MVLVAPMTQLTFVSFHLQSFLFLVFHRKWPALVGHGAFMVTEHLFIIAALQPIALGPINAGLAYALLLLVWYAVVALLVAHFTEVWCERRAGRPAA